MLIYVFNGFCSCLFAAQGHRDMVQTDHAALPELFLVRCRVRQQKDRRHAFRRSRHLKGTRSQFTNRLQSRGKNQQGICLLSIFKYTHALAKCHSAPIRVEKPLLETNNLTKKSIIPYYYSARHLYISYNYNN